VWNQLHGLVNNTHTCTFVSDKETLNKDMVERTV
jgi:hypothetical protein